MKKHTIDQETLQEIGQILGLAIVRYIASAGHNSLDFRAERSVHPVKETIDEQ